MTVRPTREQLLAKVNHWTPTRKRAAIEGVRAGIVTLAELVAAHAISPEEFLHWVASFDRHGMAGLRVTPPGLRRAA